MGVMASYITGNDCSFNSLFKCEKSAKLNEYMKGQSRFYATQLIIHPSFDFFDIFFMFGVDSATPRSNIFIPET